MAFLRTYAMTGWRVGFAVGEPEIISGMAKIYSQTHTNLTSVSQYAAIEALTVISLYRRDA